MGYNYPNDVRISSGGVAARGEREGGEEANGEKVHHIPYTYCRQIFTPKPQGRPISKKIKNHLSPHPL